MRLGQVDIVVLAAGEPRFDGSVLEALKEVAESGSVRVLDALLLTMDENGEVSGIDIEDLRAEDTQALGYIDTGTRGLFDSSDSETLAEGMVPGSAVMALAIENTWTLRLRDALEHAGAEVALTWRVPGPVVDEALTQGVPV